jgi:hypothetical protein
MRVAAMSDYFVKIFGQILDSSIWAQNDKTRILWITMLAMSNQDGEIKAAVPGLARRANIDLDSCRTAIEALLAPDLDDRSGVNEGRRIEKIQGGFKITNYLRYRTLARDIDRREYLTKKKRESRASKASTNVNNGQH